MSKKASRSIFRMLSDDLTGAEKRRMPILMIGGMFYDERVNPGD